MAKKVIEKFVFWMRRVWKLDGILNESVHIKSVDGPKIDDRYYGVITIFDKL